MGSSIAARSDCCRSAGKNRLILHERDVCVCVCVFVLAPIPERKEGKAGELRCTPPFSFTFLRVVFGNKVLTEDTKLLFMPCLYTFLQIANKLKIYTGNWDGHGVYRSMAFG